MFLNLSQETKRLQLMTHSPIISKIVELYQGLTIFRLHAKVDYQRRLYRASVDRLISLFLHTRIALISVFFANSLMMTVFILAAFLLISAARVFQWSFVPQDVNFFSVTLNWVLVIPNFIDLFMFFYAQFIQSMGSIERILLNVDPNSHEGPLRLPDARAFDESQGIRVHNVFSRYRPGLPFVLKGLSLEVASGEKVALVGRTGSGKSSFMLALTRILNIQNSLNFGQICQFQGVEPDISEEYP